MTIIGYASLIALGGILVLFIAGVILMCLSMKKSYGKDI